MAGTVTIPQGGKAKLEGEPKGGAMVLEAEGDPKPEAGADPKPEAGSDPKPEAGSDPKPEAEADKRDYKRVDTSVISLDDLAGAEVIPAEDTVSQWQETGDRSEVQLAVDAQVAAAHTSWTEAGKPQSFTAGHKAGGVHRFWVIPEKADALRKLIDNAAKFHGLTVRKAPVQKHTSGRFMLPYMAMDKKAPAKKPSATDAKAAAEAAVAAAGKPATK